MTTSQTTPTLAELKRELDDLVKAIREDDDWHRRDYLSNGRWPVVHRLARRIDEMEAKRRG